MERQKLIRNIIAADSKYIRVLRTQIKLTQVQLAQALDIARSTVAAHELETQKPRRKYINEYAAFFHKKLPSDFRIGL